MTLPVASFQFLFSNFRLLYGFFHSSQSFKTALVI
jgi:hypothetical protein